MNYSTNKKEPALGSESEKKSTNDENDDPEEKSDTTQHGNSRPNRSEIVVGHHATQTDQEKDHDWNDCPFECYPGDDKGHE